MNDPKVAFPLYERALEHGIKAVAVHKAVPLGPVVAEDAFNPGDLEGAAGAFPDLAFEILHGGIAFGEETGWLLARFPNIFINLEVSDIILERRPRTFSKMLLDMLKVGGMPMTDRFFWATGCVLAHPRATIEAFCRYEIPEDLLEDAGLLRLTSPFCEMVAYMKQETERKVGALPGVTDVSVRHDSGLDWDHVMIAPAAQARRRRRLDALKRLPPRGTARAR